MFLIHDSAVVRMFFICHFLKSRVTKVLWIHPASKSPSYYLILLIPYGLSLLAVFLLAPKIYLNMFTKNGINIFLFRRGICENLCFYNNFLFWQFVFTHRDFSISRNTPCNWTLVHLTYPRVLSNSCVLQIDRFHIVSSLVPMGL